MILDCIILIELMEADEHAILLAVLMDTGGSIEGIPVQGNRERYDGVRFLETAAQTVVMYPTSTPSG